MPKGGRNTGAYRGVPLRYHRPPPPSMLRLHSPPCFTASTPPPAKQPSSPATVVLRSPAPHLTTAVTRPQVQPDISRPGPVNQMVSVVLEGPDPNSIISILNSVKSEEVALPRGRILTCCQSRQRYTEECKAGSNIMVHSEKNR